MPHIHAQIDFVVAVFLVHARKVCLVKHKKLGIWLSVGGHIELDQLPDEAAFAEVWEEAGYQQGEVKVIEPPHARQLPPEALVVHNTRKLLTPWAVEVHDFPPVAGHRHCCNVYFASVPHAQVRLEEHAHDEIRWFSADELDDPKYGITPGIRFYGRWAIEVV